MKTPRLKIQALCASLGFISSVMGCSTPASAPKNALTEPSRSVSSPNYEKLLPKLEDSLTLYIIPPPGKLSWDSPSAVTNTTILSSIESGFHSIGHITAQVSCTKSDGSHASFWTGMTSSSDSAFDRNLIFIQQVGLGILIYPFPGRQEDGMEIYDNVVEASKKVGRPFTIRFIVNPAHCDRLAQYHEEYTNSDAVNHYGSAFHPRKKQGGGCTEYAASHVEVAGLLTPEMKDAWSKTVLIPEDAIGKPGHRVSTLALTTFPKYWRWAKPNEPHREFFIYDTQFMNDWAKNIVKNKLYSSKVYRDKPLEAQWSKMVDNYVAYPGGNGQLTNQPRSNGFFGLTLDVRDQPAATDPLWLN